MPLQKLQFRPGLNREGTDYSNEGGYFDGDKIRFRSGFPEKLGGWQQISNNQFNGVCRSIWIWADGDAGAGNTYIGLGTSSKYYIYFGGVYNDITPITYQDSYSNVISTGFTTLAANLTANANTIAITSATYFPQNNGLIKIDTEHIYYAARTSTVLTGVIRGYDNTTATTHTAGANVASAFLYVNDNSNAIDNQYLIIANATSVGGINAAVINQEHQAQNMCLLADSSCWHLLQMETLLMLALLLLML